ncbi:MAG TPA: hypothetical protein VK699_11465 [Terriglobales bacterium]|jgi:hypothetical protein|nr:hypothetical protein [Terriglobales bacterium]
MFRILHQITFALLATCLLSLSAGGQATASQGSATPVHILAPKERETVLAQMRGGIEAGLEPEERAVKDPGSNIALRDVSYGALALLQLNHDPREAEDALRRVFARQNMDSASSAYGTLPWQLNSDDVHDANSIEFGTQSWGPILLGHSDRLSSGFKKEMASHVHAAFVALQNHKVPVSYTNIYVMNTVNTILLAEAVNDHDALERGNRQLDNWIDYTSANGIHEFDSPTYYCTTLNSLGLGYRYATQPETRAKFKAALDYFWKDIAANYFVGAQRLSGPHSRDYDFLFSTGGVDLYLAAEGLLTPPPYKKLDMENTLVLENETGNAYHPGASVLAAAAMPERIVEQTWDEDRSHDRYNFITPQFAMGSANGDYGPQDKMIEIELASAQDLPGITVVPDVFDQPYGLVKSKDRSGHSKPTHVPLHPVTLQHKNVLMVLLDLDPSREKASESFATNILLPAQADEFMLDEKSFSAEQIFEKTARLNSVIGVREGNACFVARAFHADGAGGQDAALFAKADHAGLQKGVARYVIYHYRGKSQALPDAHIRVGLLMLADSCSSDDRLPELMRELREARVEDKTSDKSGFRIWNVKARIRDTTLEASRNLDTRSTQLRSINGRELQNPNLAVNGRTEKLAEEPQSAVAAEKSRTN